MYSVKSLPGGWSEFSFLTDEDKKIFEIATSGLCGVSYEPLIVSKQVVSGINYKFICNAKIIVPNGHNYLAAVTIYAPPSSEKDVKPIITDINPLF